MTYVTCDVDADGGVDGLRVITRRRRAHVQARIAAAHAAQPQSPVHRSHVVGQRGHAHSSPRQRRRARRAARDGDVSSGDEAGVARLHRELEPLCRRTAWRRNDQYTVYCVS